MASINKINSALKKAGIDGEIVKGYGYVYFAGNDFSHCDSSSVYVRYLNAFSVDQWVSYAADFKKESEEEKLLRSH